ncbi:MAG: hypothetical protein ACRC68_05865 [Clostridium sp.]
MDGDAYTWVVDVVNRKDEAEATVDRAEIEWDLDYGKSHEDSGVDFKIHELAGTVQR